MFDKLRVQWVKSAAHQLATAFATCIYTMHIFIIGHQPLLDRASKTICRNAMLTFKAIVLQNFVIFPLNIHRQKDKNIICSIVKITKFIKLETIRKIKLV